MMLSRQKQLLHKHILDCVKYINIKWQYTILRIFYNLQVNLHFLLNFNFYHIFLFHIMKKIQHRYHARLKLQFNLKNLPSILSSIVKNSQLWSNQENLELLRVRLYIQLPRSAVSEKRNNEKILNLGLLSQCFIDKFNFFQEMEQIQLLTWIILAQINQCILYQYDYNIKLVDNEGSQTSFNYLTKASQLIEGVAASGKKQLSLKFFLKNNDHYTELLPSVNSNVESDCCCKQYSSIDFPIQILYQHFKAKIKFYMNLLI
ncbi:unnamed protein product [Paramecium primaurelia]|uniref:Transmembrane protein n=1 Tax=Paramecium primaurelia TaxID=5886 RepID=A0A8S1NBQ7_PARPR|nr:unnamed protein product [Paramecium primaurelia]